jgi:hypothetical protein
MSKEIFLTNVRLSFPKLVEAQAMKDYPNAGKKFGADFILKPNDQQFANFMSEIGVLATDKWKDKAGVVLQMIQNDRRVRCFGTGAEKMDKAMKIYDGYEGMVYISASGNEDRPPVMVRPDGTVCDNSNTMERQMLARKLYGGCYVNAAIAPWVQDNQFGRGIRCQLLAVQFAKDGDPFGDPSPDFTGKFGAVAAPADAAPAFPSFFGQP